MLKGLGWRAGSLVAACLLILAPMAAAAATVQEEIDHIRKLSLDNPDQCLRLSGQLMASGRLKKEELAWVHYFRSSAWRIKQDLDRAIAEADQGLAADPNSAFLYHQRASLLVEKGEFDRAIADFTRAIALSPGNRFYYADRGLARRDKGDLDQAIADFTTAIELDPTAASGSYFFRGQAWEEKGDLGHARDDYQQAVKKVTNKNWKAPQEALARVKARLAAAPAAPVEKKFRQLQKTITEDPDKAIRLATELIASGQLGREDLATAHHHRAVAWGAKGLLDKAMADVNRGLELNPKSDALYAYRSDLWVMKGDLDRAIADRTQAISLSPKNRTYYMDRAMAWEKKGDLDRAIADFTQALAVEPNHPSSLSYLFRGQAWEKKGDFQKAKADYQATLKLNDKMQQAKDGLARVEARLAAGTGQGAIPASPNRYLLAIGVSDYRRLDKLPFVRQDLMLIRELGRNFLGVPEENLRVVENPTRMDLEEVLDWLAQAVRQSDAWVMVYYSGHGLSDEKGEAYLLPVDVNVTSLAMFKKSALPLARLSQALASAKGRHKVVVLDACRVQTAWKPAVIKTEPKMPEGQTLVFSAGLSQISNAARDKSASAFTLALWDLAQKGLTNLDGDDSGYVELTEMEKAWRSRLRQVAADPGQKPEIVGQKSVPIFPVK